MRVAYLLPSIYRPNGWRSHARGFINAISEYVEPVLFVAAEDAAAAKAFFPEYERVIVPTIQQAYLQRRHISQLAAMVWRIASQTNRAIDVVHSLEAYPAGLVGHCLALRLRRPHVLTAHGTHSILPYNSWLDRVMYKYILRHASAVCPVSPGTADLIEQHFTHAVASTYIHPILQGNDYYKFVPRREAGRHWSATEPTVLSVGPIKPQKGQHISLRAFALLKKRIPTARYWIVGNVDSTEYYRELRRFVAVNQITGVKFLGIVSEDRLQQCYREASVFLLTPQQAKLHFEGFGLVYLEAGAFGLPAIGTRTGGVSSAIRHGETGFLAESDDVEGLADHLYRLLTDHDLAQRVGHANRAWAETLTWERYAGEQHAVYREVLVSSRTQSATVLRDPVRELRRNDGTPK